MNVDMEMLINWINKNEREDENGQLVVESSRLLMDFDVAEGRFNESITNCHRLN